MLPASFQDPEGPAFTLRPTGMARFFVAAFLSVWLCGWVVGELFALAALVSCAASLLDLDLGLPGWFGRNRESHTGVVLISLFLVLWLSFWTLGGVMALRQWLLLLWSREELVLATDCLVARRWFGPFKRTRRIPRSDITSVTQARHGGAIQVRCAGTTTNLVELGTSDQRLALAQYLSAQLSLPPVTAGEFHAELPATLPAGWELTVSETGEEMLIPDRVVRRKQAHVMAVIATLLVVAFALVLSETLSGNSRGSVAGSLVLGVLAGLSVYGWLRLAHGQVGWILRSGALEYRSQLGSRLRSDAFQPAGLELHSSIDSDGDESVSLQATDGARRRIVHRTLNDPSSVRQLAQWLSSKIGVPVR